MATISIVSTMHSELGQCNVDELVRILDYLSPEVIFEEIRPSDFESRYDNEALHSLEMRAIKKYLKIKPVVQVPVDDYAALDGVGSASNSLFEYASLNSREHRELMRVQDEEIFKYGFFYLNSPEGEALNSKIQEVFEDVIMQSGDTTLRNQLSIWNKAIKHRESSMIENIYDFARNNQFTNGVFLVGSAHKSKLIEFISNGSLDDDQIDWVFTFPEA